MRRRTRTTLIKSNNPHLAGGEKSLKPPRRKHSSNMLLTLHSVAICYIANFQTSCGIDFPGPDWAGVKSIARSLLR